MRVKLLTGTTKSRIEERMKVVAAAGKLSRFPGKVTEVYDSCIDPEKNKRFINRVISMGHESITDHDYLVFAIEDVSPIVEQILIEERIASFTIKSRREVDFSNAGYYVPDFRDKDGNVLKNNRNLQVMYHEHMKYIFESYSELIKMGLKKEDARFVLPYSFHSNIIMGCDAHVLKNLIVRFTKGKESKIAELKELGLNLYEIVSKYIPYYKDVIDNATINDKDEVKEFLDKHINNYNYKVSDRVQLISATEKADDEIFISALMRVYGYDYDMAYFSYYKNIHQNENLKKELIRKILINGGEEFAQVNFRFNVPLSLAVLTHLTRHRTHKIMVPDFTPIRDLTKYKVPPTLNNEEKAKFDEIYEKNHEMYLNFKELGVCDEDLIYFYLAGTMMNITTNMDGKTLAHIARLRICNKAQWEIRNALTEIRALVLEEAPIYGSILGPDCEVFLECYEGKESCGKVKVLRERANERQINSN